MDTEALKTIVIEALEDRKAVDIRCLDVRALSNVTDCMVIASGTSRRHVKSLAENVVVCIKKQGVMPLGMEGEDQAEWVLVDLGDVVVNVMMPDTRLFYDLERLWQAPQNAEREDEQA